ncbi:nitrate ABC transporter ATP-binding protein [Brachyspira sp. G79]|nr:ABC transporter ATP-binding protein [Brachyspira sp. G79]PCG18957.1 nitrate ABC transporter ATP-binding protein [Brachyspira sp. G79]
MMMNKEVKVKISNVSKIYKGTNKDVHALDNVNLDIYKNEFVCVIGSSGCGKSTLLNILAGLDTPNSGTIEIDGKAIEGTGVDRGVVFQQYALFPWLTVAKNVAFGLELQKKSKDEINKIVDHYLKAVGLIDFKNSYPKELSGGMKQRVAIARAYAVNPNILLMDEPFGALDAQTRAQLQTELLNTWDNEKKTCFFITHDVDEAVFLAQRVVIMSPRPGRIKAIVEVPIPYPRVPETKLSKEFNDIKNELWQLVYQEYLEAKK